MAIIYCRSTDGNDADDGSTWALAKATLAAALTAAGAGGTVYVSHQHDENSSSAGISVTSSGTVDSWTTVICVNDGAEPPTASATTGVVRTTGNYGIGFYGFMYLYGLTFKASSSGGSNAAADIIFFNNGTAGGVVFEDCLIEQGSTSASAPFWIGYASGGADQFVQLVNTPIKFGSSSQYLQLDAGSFSWENTPNAIQGTAPAVKLLRINAAREGGRVKFTGLDLSPITGYLIDDAAYQWTTVNISNCKLGNGVSILTSGGIASRTCTQVYLDNCDSADTNYRMEHYKYEGSCVTVTNCKLNGDFSFKITPISGKVGYVCPLKSSPIAQWNSTTGSQKTATIEIIHNESAALKDDEIWIELEYLGTSGYPLSSFIVDKKAWFATAADQTSSTAAWTENLTGEIKQKLEVNFTPQEAGYVIAKVCIAKATTNPVYVDPVITIT